MSKLATQAEVMEFAKSLPQRDEEMPYWAITRFAEAYLMMAMRARYRPGAPSDGMGNIQLESEELADPDRLRREAFDYAMRFYKEEEDTHEFWIGCSDGRTNRAFLLVIEAARNLAGGCFGNATAVHLLRLAIEEINDAEGKIRAARNGK